MSLPSRQLFLDRFMEYNRVRYKDDPEILARLEKLTLSQIVFEGMTVDPDRPGGMVSNFSVPTGAIEAELQRWIPVDVRNENIIDPAEITTVPSIEDVITANSRGFFSYEDNGEVKLAVVMAYRPDIPVEELAKDVVKTINRSSNYILKNDDLRINFAGSTDDYRLFDIVNETISGEISVIRLANDLLNGTYWLGYLGQWAPDEVIRPSILADIVGVGNIINGDSDWLKYSLEGRILYVAKKPVANLVSYAGLLNSNLTDGNRVIDIGYDQFKVRLLSGDNSDESEWNKLIYRVSKDDPTGTFWEEFTDEELGVNTNIGGRTVSRTLSGSNVYSRGQYGITTLQSLFKTNVGTQNGWRPVLEYVGVSDIVYSPNVHMTEIVPVEPEVSGGVIGDFVYSVGPVSVDMDPSANFSEYVYKDIVYTIQGVIVKYLASGTAVFKDYSLDAVSVPLNVSVTSSADVPASETIGYQVKDVVLVNTLNQITIVPDWLDQDVNQVIATGIIATIPTRANSTLLICSGYANRQSSDGVAAGLPKSGKYVHAAEFVIESIEFTGIDIWIPETDYGDLIEEPVYNPATSFMSF